MNMLDERMWKEREFQLLSEDTQKAREAKEDLGQEGTVRRWQLADRNVLGGIYGCIKSAK